MLVQKHTDGCGGLTDGFPLFLLEITFQGFFQDAFLSDETILFGRPFVFYA